MRKLLLIGIGTGHPDHLTVQAISALRRAHVIYLVDKGSSKADLSQARRAICERHLEPGSYRYVALEDTSRDPAVPSYLERVEAWHERRLEAYARSLRQELAEDGCGAILVWGDPSLYDSALRIVQALERRGLVEFEWEVIPGISSPQVLAARHRITLNEIGGAVLVTTGRRLALGLPAGVDDVVVMLDGECTFAQLPDGDLHIYWGAYLGSEQELLISGPLAGVKSEIVRVRCEARARHGWIMDTYLIRRRPADARAR